MKLDDIALISTLRDALGYHAKRSSVLARNVANADTPGYVPQDLEGGDFAKALARVQGPRPAALAPTTTSPGHMSPAAARGPETWTASRAPDSEVTLDGNAVVLEEQMAKVAESRMNYEAAVGLYQKTLGLLRMAVRSPSR